MSITTYGWGSGPIVTTGFGYYYSVGISLVPWMTAEGIFPRRTPTPDYRLRDGVDERTVEEIAIRVRPSMISTRSIDSISTRSVDGFGRFDYLSIPARLRAAIATRDKGVIPTRDADSLATRSKPSTIAKRTRNVIPDRSEE
jgi:hypothetical protein